MEKKERECQNFADEFNAPVFLVGANQRRSAKELSIVTQANFFPREDLSIYYAAWPEDRKRQ
jgi:hypothetical protein